MEAVAAAAAGEMASEGLHDPPLEPRDEAMFLLHAAAEVEHALMVQYLFAAYSLRAQGQTPEHADLVEEWRALLLQIAREEMAHLATVQNLLIVLGGSLNFEREHSPFTSQLYPFRFKLQPLTLRSLAKYVTAERPRVKPPDLEQAEWDFITGPLEQTQAIPDNDGYPLQQVGGIFARLCQVLREVPAADFHLDSAAFQARFSDWGYDPEDSTVGDRLLVESISGVDAEAVRTAAVNAVKAIAIQGEGFDSAPPELGEESHFERFYQVLYKGFRDATQGAEWEPTWPLPVNPNTSSKSAIKKGDMFALVEEHHLATGRIEHPRTRLWAQLFNLRYRMLLGYLSHFLRLDASLVDGSVGPTRGDRTPRGFLLVWTFNEMRRLRKLAGKLVQLPLTEDLNDRRTAGPPFELDYTLNLPDRNIDRWRIHRDVLRAAKRLVERLRAAPPDSQDPFLGRLLELDDESLRIAEALATGRALPAQPDRFRKVVRILEESVRGFDIGYHRNFWRDRRLNEFVGVELPVVGKVIDPATDPPNPRNARLVRRIADPVRWMPRKRPQIPTERIDAIVDWIAAGCPDGMPAGEKGFSAEGDPSPEPNPPPAPLPLQASSFAADIKPLFRDFDRDSMRFLFDLWRYEDVRDNAQRILDVVSSGSMPCDGAWPQTSVELFKKWIEDGAPP